MMLSKAYKTLAGAQKRASFENAYSKTHTYTAVRHLDHVIDTKPYDINIKSGRYTWRLEKLKRAKATA